MQSKLLSFLALVGLAIACTPSQQSCNGQCYNPSSNSCPTDSYTGKPVLCGYNYLSCNGACYSPTQYHCLASGALAGGPASAASTTSAAAAPSTTSAAIAVPASTTSSAAAAPRTTSAAATPAISAAAQTCSTAGCGPGTCNCNGACYTPGQYSCPFDTYSGKTMLCQGSLNACNGNCYDATAYSCSNGALVQGAATPAAFTSASVPATTSSQVVATPSTSSQAATPSTSSQVATPSTSSQAVTPSTSSQAVTPSTSSQAAATTAAPSCGAGCGAGACNCNGACYTPGIYNCPVDSYTGKTMLCSGSLAACNGICYDSTKYYCANGALAYGVKPVPSTGTPATTASPPVVNPTPVPAPSNRPVQTADLRIINSCSQTLWFEARYGGAGAPIPGQSVTSTQAFPGAYVDYTVPSTGLSGSRFWAKYGCDNNGQNCAVGDQMQYWPNPPGGCPANGCTPPVDSLFEATWGCRPGASCNSQNPTTWFDTSQVDGWTIPYKLTPNGDTSGCDCVGSSCGFAGVDASRLDLAKCPQGENLSYNGQFASAIVGGLNVSLNAVDLRIISNNQVLGCMSPCKRLNWGAPYGLQQPEDSGATMWMCCPTPTPSSCSPSNGCITPNACRAGPIVNTQYVNAVHTMAPGVYSYSYDDGVGLHACPAGVVTYTMEFCPSGSAQYPLPL